MEADRVAGAGCRTGVQMVDSTRKTQLEDATRAASTATDADHDAGGAFCTLVQVITPHDQKTLFNNEPTPGDHRNVASAVFCQPPLSVVGLSEDEAVEKCENEVLVFTSTFNPMKYTISGRQEKALMKLIVDGKTDKILGAGMVGPDAAEIIQGIAIAIKAGATKKHFDTTIGIHPSTAEEFVTMRTPTRRHPPKHERNKDDAQK